ncbi:MAG: tetratricopeptide repeat protein [Pyrinomonadaceae bacterium]|nr:tetratricopeptide repeat protein [Pyrinomonadaceae bacterium]
MKAKSFICVVVVLLFLASISFAQKTYIGNPVTKNGLIKALKLHQFQTSDIVQIINEQGVDFKLTPDVQAELVSNGARPELLDAVRRNFRGESKVKPAISSNKPTNSNPKPAISTPKPTNSVTYENLITQAVNLYESERNSKEAIKILNQAAGLDPNKYRAYQMLGYVYMYGEKNSDQAEIYMRKAIDLGGSAVFRVRHAHDAAFSDSCEGSFYVSKNMIRYEDDSNQHTFQVKESDVVKIDTEKIWNQTNSARGNTGSGLSGILNGRSIGDKIGGAINIAGGLIKLKKDGLFKVEIRGRDKDNYVFSSVSEKGAVAKMIIRLVGKG